MVRRIYHTQRRHGSHLKVYVRPCIRHLLAAGCGAALLLTACSSWSREQKLLEGAWIGTQAIAAIQTSNASSEAAPAAMAYGGKHPSDQTLWLAFGVKTALHFTITSYLHTDKKLCRIWQGGTLAIGLLDVGRNAAVGISLTK